MKKNCIHKIAAVNLSKIYFLPQRKHLLHFPKENMQTKQPQFKSHLN